jgi:hypothetical protein
MVTSDVSGTGTFSEAVTITTGGLAVSAGRCNDWCEIQDWWTIGLCRWCYNYRYRLNGTCWGRYVVDGDLDVSGTGTFGEAVTI